MVTQAPTRGVVAVTVLFALSAIGLILYVWASLGGSTPLQARGYRFHARFPDASQLTQNADVRIAGVDVGKVVKVDQHAQYADTTIQLKSAYAPIAVDTHAILRQKTLLGETFVALTQGSPGAATIKDGGLLPARDIGTRQPLDRLLGALDTRTRANLQKLLTGSSVALADRGADLNDAFGQLNPAAAQLATISAILDRQRTPVGSLVRDTGSVLRTLGSRTADVRGLVRAGDAVLAETAARDRGVTDTVTALPPALRQLQSTMRDLDTTAAIATPTLQALRPAARDAPAALRGLYRLSPQVSSLFRGFRTLIPVARRSLPAAGSLVKVLPALTDQVAPGALNITPVIDLIGQYRNELVADMANLGDATQAATTDSTGVRRHFLRALTPLSEEGVIGYTRREPFNRHNAYPAPGTLATIGREGLPASDCRNLANPTTAPLFGTGAPACRVQAPFTVQGAARYYPQLQPAAP